MLVDTNTASRQSDTHLECGASAERAGGVAGGGSDAPLCRRWRARGSPRSSAGNTRTGHSVTRPARALEASRPNESFIIVSDVTTERVSVFLVLTEVARMPCDLKLQNALKHAIKNNSFKTTTFKEY